MSKKDEALKLALEALEQMTRPRPSFDAHKNAITAIREALAEQPAQQEPVALPEKIYEFVPTPEPAKWHHPECEGECIACLIEQVVQKAYGSQGLGYLQRHLTSPPARKPLTHEQRVDLLAKFEPHKHEWHAPAILIDMVEAAHNIKETP